jgi:dTDP-4-dehydrorhamnose 3,5-epimerase
METINAVEKTKLPNVLLIKLAQFEDHRGTYVELYNEELYQKHGVKVKFVQDDISTSSRGVLRGIHGNADTWKLVSCLYGKFYLVVIDCDPKSPRFGQWQSFLLSDRNRHQVLIPPMHGNAHLVLSREAIYHYKQSTYYEPKSQFTYRWDDPRFKIWWPIKDPIISQRDEVGHFVE